MLKSSSLLDAQVAAFTEKQEKEVPYASDAPLLGREDIVEDMEALENRYAVGIAGTLTTETDKALGKVDRILGDNSPNKMAALEEIEWGASTAIQKVLHSLWSESWDLGQRHATQELNLNIYRKGARSSFSYGGRLATFNVDDPDVPIPYPPDYGMPLSSTNLKQAVDQRTLKLANDVTFKTAGEIQSAVRGTVESHRGGYAVPRGERQKLVSQINLALGRQSRREILDENKDVGDPLVATRRVGTVQTSRAKVIARTELGAAYNLGRLEVYLEAGVKQVRWQAVGDLRTCDVCSSRNGTVHDLRRVLSQSRTSSRSIYDPSQYVLPAHPNDRCHWEPVLDDLDEDEGRNPETRDISRSLNSWVKDGVKSSTKAGVGTKESLLSREAARQTEKRRAAQSRKLFAKAAIGVGAGALSISLLYQLLSAQEGQQEIRKVRQGITKTQERIAKGAAALVQGETALESRLKQEDQARLQRLLGSKESQASEPQNSIESELPPDLLPGEMLARYPELTGIQDVRQLTLEDLVRVGVERPYAPRMYAFIRRHLESNLGLPSVMVAQGTTAGGIDLATASPEQIMRLLPANLKNKEVAARNIALFMKNRAIQGRPVQDIGELREVQGVGKKSLDSIRSKQSVPNINSVLMGFHSDDGLVEILAPRLGLGAKKTRQIIKLFREGGQFRDIDDLVSRLDESLRGTRLHLSPKEEASLRQALEGKIFQIPSSGIKNALNAVQTQSIGGANEVELRRITSGRVPSQMAGVTPPKQIEGRAEPGRIEGSPSPGQITGRAEPRQMEGAPTPSVLPQGDTPPPRPRLPEARSRLEIPAPPGTEEAVRQRRVNERLRRNQARQTGAQAIEDPWGEEKPPIITPNSVQIKRRNANRYEDIADDAFAAMREYQRNVRQLVQGSTYQRRFFGKDITLGEAETGSIAEAEKAYREASEAVNRLLDYVDSANGTAEEIRSEYPSLQEMAETDTSRAERRVNQLKRNVTRLLRQTVQSPVYPLEKLEREIQSLEALQSRAQEAAQEAVASLQQELNRIDSLISQVVSSTLDIEDRFTPRLQEIRQELVAERAKLSSPNLGVSQRMSREVSALNYQLGALQNSLGSGDRQEYFAARTRLAEEQERLRSIQSRINTRKNDLLNIENIDRRSGEILYEATGSASILSDYAARAEELTSGLASGEIHPNQSFSSLLGNLTKLGQKLSVFSRELQRLEGRANGYLNQSSRTDAERIQRSLGLIAQAKQEIAERLAEIPAVKAEVMRGKAVQDEYNKYQDNRNLGRESATRFSGLASRQVRKADEVLNTIPEQQSGAIRFEGRQDFRRVMDSYESAVNAENFFEPNEKYLNGIPTIDEDFVSELEGTGRLIIPEVEDRPPVVRGYYNRTLQRFDQTESSYQDYVRRREALSSEQLPEPSPSGLVRQGTARDRSAIQQIEDAREQAHQVFERYTDEYLSRLDEGVSRARVVRNSFEDGFRSLPSPNGEDYNSAAQTYINLRNQINQGEAELNRLETQLQTAKRRQRARIESRMTETERQVAEWEQERRRAGLQIWDSQIYARGGQRADRLAALNKEKNGLESAFLEVRERAEQVPWDTEAQESYGRRLSFLRSRIAETAKDIREVRGISELEEDALFSSHLALATFSARQKRGISLRLRYIKDAKKKLYQRDI